MAKLPTSPKLPWREQDIRSGDHTLLADYLKSLIKTLQKILGEICDVVNINANQISSGGGDMYKATYDPDDDGIVEEADHATNSDNADKIDNKDAIDFINIDGSTSPISDINWGGYKIKQLGDPEDIEDAVNKKYLAEAVSTIGSRYYMTDADSGIADYKLCSTNPSSDSEQSISATDVTDGQYIGGWISPTAGEPSKLLAGVFNWRVYVEKTGGQKTLRLYWQLVERKSDDSEVVIGTSILSNEIVTDKNSYIIPLTLYSDYEIASDSYVVCKIYASVSGNGNDPSLTIYYQGLSASHFQIPVNTEILDNRYYTKSEANDIFLDKATYDPDGDGKVEEADHAANADDSNAVGGYGISQLPILGVVASGSDLNDVTRSGLYRLEDNLQNAPSGVEWGQLIVSHGGGGDTVLQIVSDYSSGKIYWRSGNPLKDGGSWGAWKQLIDEDDLGGYATTSLSNVDDSTVLDKVKNVDGSGSGLDADLIRGLPGDFTASKQQNGYTKLPNGVIIQWGRATGSSSGNTVTFPIAFPNACCSVVAIGYGGDVSDSTNTAVDNVTTSSFVLRNAGGWGCCWIAVGY